MQTQTIRQAFNEALAVTIKQGIPSEERAMVACLAVNGAMQQTLENKTALLAIMREVRTAILN